MFSALGGCFITLLGELFAINSENLRLFYGKNNVPVIEAFHF